MRRIRTHEDGHGLTELCEVYAEDDPHPINGANHVYVLRRKIGPDDALPDEWKERHRGEAVYSGEILFQRGPRAEPDSTAGILDGCLLAVLIDRYEAFQRGPFACGRNDEVLTHLRAALECMKQRAGERAQRSVLGKNEK